MKFKRFLSLVVSLAMVLSIVPAFSLTASAAAYAEGGTFTYDGVTYNVLTDNLVYNGDFSETTNDGTYTYVTGWKGGYVNASHKDLSNRPYLQEAGAWAAPERAVFNYTEASGSEPAYVTIPDSSAMNSGATYPWQSDKTENYMGLVLTNWIRDSRDSTAQTYLKAKAGKQYYLSFEIKATTLPSSWIQNVVGFGAVTENGDTYASKIPGTNGDINTLTHVLDTRIGRGRHISAANTWTKLETVATANSDGYFMIQLGWGYEWGAVSLRNVEIYEIEIPATTVEVTATYTVDGTTVNTVTKSYDSSTASSASFGELYYSENGTNTLYYTAGASLTENDTIVLQPVEHWGEYTVGDEFVKNNTPYKITSGNLIPNGNFAHGIEGWYAADGSKASALNFTTNAENGSVYLVGNGGSSAAVTLRRSWAVENGKTYAFVYTQSQTSTDRKWQRFSLGNTFASNNDAMLSGAGAGDVETGQSVEVGTNIVVFTNTDGYAYATFIAAWSGGITLSNFGLYEVEVDTSKIAKTTIKFVDSSNTSTEIAPAVTVTGVVGDTIDLTDTSIVPETITYNNNLYSKDSSNATSYTVEGNTDTATITYTTDAVTSFETITATVIEGNDPILPTRIKGYTGSGAATDVEVTWASHTGLSAGTHSITGTADGINATATASVTVLEQTFALDDLSSWNSQDEAKSNATIFPVAINDEFYIEMDVKWDGAFVNDFITLRSSSNPGFFGPEQIAIGFNDAAGFRPVNGNGEGGRAATDETLETLQTGVTYRFLIKGDASTDKYTVTLTKPDGTTVVAADYGFRTVSNDIASVVIMSNGGSYNGAFNATNVKVYAPSVEDQFAAYTVNVTGSVKESYTEKAVSAEDVSIPYYEGNILKTRTVNGTTITLTYEETTTSLGSWVTRNNVTSNTWLTEMKYLGSHDSFTDKIKNDSSLVDNAGVTYGDSGATAAKNYLGIAGSTIVNVSKAQSADALTQLNAGVRYFDIRLSRQADGVFWTRHGLLSEQFRGIATTIAQFAKENPGEVILLDFQSLFDGMYGDTYDVVTGNTAYYGESAGDDNAYAYAALVQLLEETGIMEFVPSNWDAQWGAATNEGEKAVILLFAKSRGANCQNVFINRSSNTSNTTTYNEDSSYNSVVSTLNSTYTNINAGPNFGIIHAYTTTSIGLSGGSLIDDAATNNPKWINEENFDAWMDRGKGDIIIMDDVVNQAPLYIAKMAEYNRDGRDGLYGNEYESANGKTVNGVTLTGTGSNIPYSTEFVVNSGDASAIGTITIGNTEYTPVTAYTLDLMQFGTNSVQPTGDVTLTFPKISADTTTIDVLLNADGTEVLATANIGEAISYQTTALADVILATKVAPGVNLTVQYVADGTVVYENTDEYAYGLKAYDVPAGDFYIAYNGKAYIVNSAEAQSYTVSTSDTAGTILTVNLTMVTDKAVLADTFADNGGAKNNNTENMLFVGSSGIADPGDADADGNAVMANNGGNVGAPRIPVLMFNKPAVEEGKAVKLHVYVAKANENLNNGSMKFAANVTNTTVDETLGYVASSVANTTAVKWSDTMFTAVGNAVDHRREVNTWIEIDVTELVMNATGDTITFTLYAPTAGAYVADREKTVAGGAYQGKAAYLEIVDANTVTVKGATKVTKMGTEVALTDGAAEVTVPEDSTIKVYTDDPYVTDGTTTVYTVTNGVTEAFKTTDGAEYYAATLGVAMVDGAQVRIGGGVDENGKVGAGSGLRFITTVDYNETLAAIAIDDDDDDDDDDVTLGVEITAEGSDKVLDIVAKTFQGDGAVYTSAITNLAVTNYNRKFTATPYVNIDGQKFYGTPITRSIYQVAAGLLVKGDSDGTSYDETAFNASALYDVLNAYVNQTGIRLAIVDNGLIAHEDVENNTSTKGGKYTGDAFFNVVSTGVENNVYTITIKPSGTKTTINSYWQEYIRINNNHSAIAEYTSMADNGDGTVTITFDYASYLAANAQ